MFTGALYFILGKILAMAEPVVPVGVAIPTGDTTHGLPLESDSEKDGFVLVVDEGSYSYPTLMAVGKTAVVAAATTAGSAVAGAAASAVAGATGAAAVAPGYAYDGFATAIGAAASAVAGATGAAATAVRDYGPAAVDVALLATKITVKVVAAGITGAIDEARTCIEKEKEKKKE